MRVVGRAEKFGALLPLRGGHAEVDVMGRHQAEGTVAMLRVVPREEAPAERLGILVRSEPRREVRPVLEGLELGLGGSTSPRRHWRSPRPRGLAHDGDSQISEVDCLIRLDNFRLARIIFATCDRALGGKSARISVSPVWCRRTPGMAKSFLNIF